MWRRFLKVWGGGVSAVVVLECYGSRHGLGVGGRLVDRKMLGWRCDGYDRRDDCGLEGRSPEGRYGYVQFVRGQGAYVKLQRSLC